MLEHNKGYAENLAAIQARKSIFKYSEFYTSYEEGWNDAIRKPISDFEMEAAQTKLLELGKYVTDDEMFDLLNASRDARVNHYEERYDDSRKR